MSNLSTFQQKAADLEHRLADTLENMADAFYLLTPDLRFAYLNSEAERLLRRSKSDLIGRDLLAEFPQARDTVLWSTYNRALASGLPKRFDLHYPPLDTWFDVSVYPVPDGLAVYFRDITARRADREHLRLLEAAVARQNDVLIITDADPIDAPDGPRIVYVNDAFVRRTGYSRAEAIGRTPRILQGPDTDRAELDRIREALAAGQSVRSELLNYTKSGEPYWLELDIVPLADESGGLTHFVAVERDITERKHTEEALRISDERFRLVSQATSDVIRDRDLTTNTIWWSEGFRTVFGYEAAEQATDGRAWLDRIHPEDRDRVRASIDALIASRETHWAGEYRFLHADGRALVVSDRAFVIRDDRGNAVRILGSMNDMTGQREMESRLRQSQRLESIGLLTGGVAHDFNNLLTVILGNAELITGRLPADSSLRTLAEMSMAAAERGAELTNSLLAFARRQPLDPKPVDVNRLLRGMQGLLQRTLQESVEISLSETLPLSLTEIDPGQLETAILNLAINARDAMPAGGKIIIETANVDLDDHYAALQGDVSAGSYVMVSVSDTGTGMSPEHLARVFEPFFTTKEVGKGTGLGLSMVYGFVKQSRGHVRIYSEPGQGTTVKLYFPCATSGEEPAIDLVEPEELVGGNEHILVVEDDRFVREYIIEQLRGLGYNVSSAGDGPQALELIMCSEGIDLLFADIVMPGGMTGRDLAEAANRIRPALKVLFTSGYTENSVVHHGRLDPGVQLLSKPYHRRDLAAKIRKVLSRQLSD